MSEPEGIQRLRARIASVEAELGDARRASRLNFDRARSAEAQLAEAHQALEAARRWLSDLEEHAPWTFGGAGALGHQLDAALSAPACARAAELDRLRRGACDAADAVLAKLTNWTDFADFEDLFDPLSAALDRLRAAEAGRDA